MKIRNQKRNNYIMITYYAGGYRFKPSMRVKRGWLKSGN